MHLFGTRRFYFRPMMLRAWETAKQRRYKRKAVSGNTFLPRLPRQAPEDTHTFGCGKVRSICVYIDFTTTRYHGRPAWAQA